MLLDLPEPPAILARRGFQVTAPIMPDSHG